MKKLMILAGLLASTSAFAATGTVTATHIASDCNGFQIDGDTSKWYVTAPGLTAFTVRVGDRIGFALRGPWITTCAWTGRSQVIDDINMPPQGPND